MTRLAPLVGFLFVVLTALGRAGDGQAVAAGPVETVRFHTNISGGTLGILMSGDRSEIREATLVSVLLEGTGVCPMQNYAVNVTLAADPPAAVSADGRFQVKFEMSLIGQSWLWLDGQLTEEGTAEGTARIDMDTAIGTCLGNSVPWVATPCGDVSADGGVDSRDALLVLQLKAGLLGELANPASGDTNGDGRIDPIDALLILQVEADALKTLACSG